MSPDDPLMFVVSLAVVMLGVVVRPIPGKDRSYRLGAQMVFYALPVVWMAPFSLAGQVEALAPLLSAVFASGVAWKILFAVFVGWVLAMAFHVAYGIWNAIRGWARKRGVAPWLDK